jgi:hypothetical protein
LKEAWEIGNVVFRQRLARSEKRAPWAKLTRLEMAPVWRELAKGIIVGF